MYYSSFFVCSFSSLVNISCIFPIVFPKCSFCFSHCGIVVLSAIWWSRLGGLCKLPDGRDWWWEKLSLALVGRALLSKTLIQLSADGWGCPPSVAAWDNPALGSVGYGFNFIMIVPFLPSRCDFCFVLGHGYLFFCGSQRPPINDCSTGRCSFVAFTGGNKLMSFYSAILNWKYPSPLNIYFLNNYNPTFNL